MNSMNVLSVLAAVQLGLTLFTWWEPEPAAPTPLLEVGDLSEVTVLGDDGYTVRFDSDGAVVSSHGDLPVDPAKASQLRSWAEVEVSSPVVTNEANMAGVSLDSEGALRRVRFSGDDGNTELWLSASSGQSAMVRRAEEPAAYRVKGRTAFSIPGRASSVWKSPMFEAPAVVDRFELRVGGEHFVFTDGDDGWTVADLPEGMEVDQEAVEGWLSAWKTLRASDVALEGSEELYSVQLGESTLVWSTGKEDHLSVESDGLRFQVRAGELPTVEDLGMEAWTRPAISETEAP